MEIIGKNVRSFAWVLCALCAAAGILMALPHAAYAVGAGTITVSSDSPEFNGKTVSAVKMFDVSVDAAGAVTYVLDEETWGSFFTDAADNKYGCSGLSGTALSEAAFAYVNSLGEDDATAVTAFAEEARVGFVVSAQLVDANVVATGESAPYTATFSNLDLGYYLLYADGSTSAERKTSAMLVNLTDASNPVNIMLKSEYPTIDMYISEGNVTQATGNYATAQIGDTVTVSMATKVPDMSAYTKYNLEFQCQPPAGMSIVRDSVKVTVGGQLDDRHRDDTYPGDIPGKTLLQVAIYTEMKSEYADKVGESIVVTFQAQLNGSASIEAANNFEAWVQYPIDPSYAISDTKDGETVHKTVAAYTYDFAVDKFAGDYGETALRLPGAVFELRRSADASGEALALVKIAEGDASVPAQYRIATPSEKNNAGATTTTIITPQSGKVTIAGVGAASVDEPYMLTETKAPAGYSKLAAPIAITLTPMADTPAQHALAYGGISAVDNNTVLVQNTPTGDLLPTTGGAGTVAFAVAGAVLVAVGVAWGLVRRASRKNRI